ncbi:Hsp70 family protein [Rhodococcus sp. BP22]|uniref:Hsp70 family protein n=1 Tax=Rhodococcus sp. BP22 TaxID=2758566 RepID=UPI001645334D|nr:Hsp70 family protein [Rhodococcus sp. BP22]
MDSAVGISMGASGIRAVRTVDGRSFSTEWFPTAGPTPDAEDVAHAIRAVVDRPDAPHSLGVAFPDPGYSAALKAALVEEYVSEVRVISEVAGTLEQLRADPEFRYRTVVLYDLGATGLEMTVADIDSGTVYAATRTSEMSGEVLDRAVRDHLLTLDILAIPRTESEEHALLEFSCEIKEALSTHEATQTSDGAFRLLDRHMFELQIMRAAEHSAIALRDLAEMSEIPPEVVVAIGGGARIPLLKEVLERYLRIPVVVPGDPELISARGAALYAARVDQQQTAESGASRWSVTSLLTPLVRFGLPTLAALSFFTWMLWPGAGEEPSLTGTQDTAVEKPTAEKPTAEATTTPLPKTAVTTTVVVPTADAAPVTTTAPPVASTTETRYVPDRSTDETPEAPPAPPPPRQFQLPPLQLPKFQLPELPRLPLP